MNWFILSGGSWIFERTNCLVMALEMFVDELRVHELTRRPYANNLVVQFFMMDQFVSYDGVDGTEEAHYKGEPKVITPSLWLGHLEKPSLWIDLIAHDDKRPNPCKSLKHNKELKWNVKPLIFLEENC